MDFVILGGIVFIHELVQSTQGKLLEIKDCPKNHL